MIYRMKYYDPEHSFECEFPTLIDSIEEAEGHAFILEKNYGYTDFVLSDALTDELITFQPNRIFSTEPVDPKAKYF